MTRITREKWDKLSDLAWGLIDVIYDFRDMKVIDDNNSHSLVEMCDIVRK